MKKSFSFHDIYKNKYSLISIILSIVLVLIIIIAVIAPYYSEPSSISPEKYIKVNHGDLLKNGSSAIYYISWYGCPVGATDSWPLYYAMNSSENISSMVTLHRSSPTDLFANNSGLLFNKNITFKNAGTKFTFYPLYMYNQTMTGTIHNKSLSSSARISYGLSLINKTFPSSVAKIFNKYSSDISFKEHLETTFIITGPHGTYIYNLFMYNPVNATLLGSGTSSSWTPNTPQHVMAHLNSSATIKTASSTFEKYLGKAD